MKRIGMAVALILIWMVGAGPSLGQTEKTNLMHPTFRFLDPEGEHVLESGGPVSTMQTCGNCHDTDFIANHSYHSDVGLRDIGPPGQTESGRPWDTSPGLFGRWNPLIYRYLSSAGDEQIDLGTAAWIQLIGARHVGGGPAWSSRDGLPLDMLQAGEEADPETHVADPETGEVTVWDWRKSGGVEMNCFLCHTPNPDNDERLKALAAGDFRWSATATLEGTGIVEATESGGWRWNAEAFDRDGHLEKEFIRIQDPQDDNCGLCHGLVQVNPAVPIITTGCLPDHWGTETTGQIRSPQRIRDSGMNLAGKQDLSRAWDIHSERLVGCTDCHYSLNNPVYVREEARSSLSHLRFDARRMDISEYLYRPSHQFAKGQVTQGALAPELAASMRGCESCHRAEVTHQWLPYKERHFSVLACESCHIPSLYSPARRRFDWTVITPESNASIECRGVEGDFATVDTLIEGYRPVLLPRHEVDGATRLVPHNLISAWYWVAGAPERPVLMRDLQAVYLEGERYASEVLQSFDADKDGELSREELKLDTPEKVELIRGRLVKQGLKEPRIKAEIQPYGVHHDVATGVWATKDCQTCHEKGSRLAEPMLLSSYVPGGVEPVLVGDANVSLDGEIFRNDEGQLYYQPSTATSGLYVSGTRSRVVGQRLGAFVGAGCFDGCCRPRRPSPACEKLSCPGSEVRRVYMYSGYERLWHWLQSLAIMLLLITGLEIHMPGTVRILGFAAAVKIHNIVAFVVVINALLSAFFHFASGQIRQYLPEPKGFFSQAIQQIALLRRRYLQRRASSLRESRPRGSSTRCSR